MVYTADDAAIDTLELLSVRLRRIEFLLQGEDAALEQKTIASRLSEVEKSFQDLTAGSPLTKELLQLYARFPKAFGDEDASKRSPDIHDKRSIVTSSATAYSTTSSNLTIMNEMPIPSAESSAALIETQPRAERLKRIQEAQEEEVSQLRARTARLLERWYGTSVLESGKCWADWDKRLLKVEQELRRHASAEEREEQL